MPPGCGTTSRRAPVAPRATSERSLGGPLTLSGERSKFTASDVGGAVVEVFVDPGRCEGHGKCYLLVPEVFEPEDDWGHARVLRSIDPEDGALRRRVQRAIDGCPESALSWRSSGGAPGSARTASGTEGPE